MAAEIAVPERRDIEVQVRSLFDRLHDRTTGLIQQRRQRVESLAESRALHRPVHDLAQHRQSLDHLISRLSRAGTHTLEQHRHRLDRIRDRLHGLDPEAPLRRGYALVNRGETPIRRAEPLHPDDTVLLHFLDGDRHARITDAPPDS
jgi:exodeoxyribonuclease VII large subunit